MDDDGKEFLQVDLCGFYQTDQITTARKNESQFSDFTTRYALMPSISFYKTTYSLHTEDLDVFNPLRVRDHAQGTNSANLVLIKKNLNTHTQVCSDFCILNCIKKY